MNQSRTSTPPHKILQTFAVSGFAALATVASSVAVALPASAISFNLSYTDAASNTVNSVVTTDGTSYATNTIYTFTGISGNVNGVALLGLGDDTVNFSFNNKFVWDGATGIKLTNGGILFKDANSVNYNLFSNDSSLVDSNNPADYLSTSLISYPNSTFAFNNVTSLSLTPVAATPVPFDFDPSFGLLALGGAWTVRKMIKKSKSVVNK